MSNCNYTLDPNNMTPAELTSGYVVSDSRTIKISAVLLNTELESAILATLRNIAIAENSYIGAWLDRDTGIVHFDISRVIYDYSEACTLARMFDQIAIWDIQEGIECRM